MGRGGWARSGDRPAPVRAARAPPGAVPLTIRGGRMVDPQPAPAPDPGDCRPAAARGPARPGVPPPRGRPRGVPDTGGAAWDRLVPEPRAAAHRPPALDRPSRPRRSAGPGPAAGPGARGGDGGAATAPRHRSDLRRVDPAAIDRGDGHPPPRRAADRVLRAPLLRTGRAAESRRALADRRGLAPLPYVGGRAHPRRRRPGRG